MPTVTMRDVAKYADVGLGTVSRVINQSPNVSHATRQKVLEAISILNYRPNVIARQLSLGKTMTIGAIVPTFTRPSFVERLRGLVMTFGESDYDLIIYSVESQEQRNKHIKHSTIQDRVDGVIIISIDLSDDEADAFANSGISTTLLDSFHPSLNSIYIDDVKGGRMATQHLIDLEHRRIGMICDHFIELGNGSMVDRYNGYREALDSAEIPYDPALSVQIEHSQSAARTASLDLLTNDNRPTAIFAASDTQAIGVLQAAQQLNIQVPQELSIIGFDNIESAEYFNLTTIQQPLIDSGVIGAQLAIESVAAQQADKQPIEPRQIEMATALIQRSSTAHAPLALRPHNLITTPIN